MAIRPELREAIRTLPRETRQALADEIYAGLAEEPLDPEWERAWGHEIMKRVGDVVAERVELIDADEVHAELQAELRNARR